MPTTSRGLPYPPTDGSSSNNVPVDLKALADAVDAMPGVAVLTLAQRNALPAWAKWDGRLIFNLTTQLLERWRASDNTWQAVDARDDAATMPSLRSLGDGPQQAAPGNHLHDSRYPLKTEVFTKTETSAGLATKADSSAVYTKAAVDTALAAKSDIGHGHSLPALASLPGVAADAQLPGRLTAKQVSNWNDATQSGWYFGNSAANGPSGDWYVGFVESFGGTGWVTQTVHAFTADSSTDTQVWRRHLNADVWGTWYRLRWSEAELDARYALKADRATWQAWSPTVDTNNGAVAHSIEGAWYTHVGKTVHYNLHIWLTGTVGSSYVLYTLPVAASLINGRRMLGYGIHEGKGYAMVSARAISTTRAQVHTASGGVTSDTAGVIQIAGTYEAATAASGY